MAPGAGVSDESHMFQRLVSHGYDIDLLVPRSGQVADLGPGIEVHTMANVLEVPGWIPAPGRRLWLLPSFCAVAARAAVRRVRERAPAIVIGFSHYGAYPAWRAGRTAGVPSVLKLFGVMHAMRLDWPLPRYLYHSLEGVLAFKTPVDHFIILNDGTRGEAVARRWGVPAERITYLPNGIDTQWADLEIDRATVRRELGAPDDAVVVLSLSRLVHSKRVDRIVDAMASVKNLTSHPVELWVAGDGPLRGAIEAQCRTHEVPVRFLGTIQHDRVPSILAAADLFVSTSTLTNMSIPTCEAMVVGTPVVALDVGGTSEVVHHEETGLLVAEDDRAGLAQAIARLANDPALRARLSTRSRAFASRNFMSWDERVSHEIALLDRLAGGSPTATTSSPRAGVGDRR
jgi:glycosyltransferase involved in cell wall biosynthesis